MLNIFVKFRANILSCYLIPARLWPTLGQNPGNGKMRKKQNGSKNIALHPLGIGGVLACQK